MTCIWQIEIRAFVKNENFFINLCSRFNLEAKTTILTQENFIQRVLGKFRISH